MQTPISTPQKAVPGTPDSVLNSSLANGELSKDSTETDLETPFSAPQAETPLPPATQPGKRSGKKKKKRGRKPKEKSQIDNSTAVSEPGVLQQQFVDQNSRTGTALGGGGGGEALPRSSVPDGDDILRTSREQMEVDNRRSIGSSSSMISSLANPYQLNNNYGSNQVQPVTQAVESGQSRLTEQQAPSLPSSAVGVEVTTPLRESPVIGIPLGAGGVVRVKQEPITNHEEEMETNQPPPLTQHPRQPTTKVLLYVDMYMHVV